MNCKPWDKYIRPNGYGEARVNGKTVKAHRLAYAKANGISIDEISGLVIRHKCDNPCCVNPEHLEVGDMKDNSNDAVKRNRIAYGERQHSAKLNDNDVRGIRKLIEDGISQREIAQRYGVAQSQIYSIKNGKTWRRVS